MGPKISAGGASGDGQLAVPANAFVREDGVITAPPAPPSAAPLASPAFTGTPTAPTASPLTSSTQVATTAYADAAVAARVVSGQFLCAPNVYAPASRVTPSVNSTTLAAFSSGVICTNTFTAPSSGKVVVGVSCVLDQSTGGDTVMFGLAAAGTVTPLFGNTVTLGATANTEPVSFSILVTGLTAGQQYQFDLLGAAQSTTTATIFAQGLTSTAIGNSGGPVTMTVLAV